MTFLRALVAIPAAVVAIAFAFGPAAADGPATFAAGEQAYISLRFDQARQAYAVAAASPQEPAKERASALRQLGVMAWRLYERNDEAQRYFDQALAVGADLVPTQIERARFAWSTKRFDDAIAAADAATRAATTQRERQGAAQAFARAITAKLKGVGIAEQSAADRALLARARDLIRPFSDDPPLSLNLSAVLLEVAVRLDDGPLALTAWHSYAREGAAVGTWAPAATVLRSVLPSWRGQALTSQARAQVFDALALSQFHEIAALVAQDTRIGDQAALVARPRVREVIAYAAFKADVRDATDRYYRARVAGRGDSQAWMAALGAAGAKVWEQLDFAAARPAYSNAALNEALAARFGAYITIGETSGVLDLHYGHVFLDDPRTIEQYGHRASIRRIAIDRMVDNGYESWVWDGRQSHGGWAKQDRVYQVRPGYADSALGEWNLLIDPARRAEEEARIARLSAGDDEIARRNPTAFMPGLAARLDWQGPNNILERARRAAPTSEVKARFMIDYLRIGLDANFFAHEGRHILDQQAFGDSMQSEELEFRAKLSEIAFSEEPRLSFGPITNPTIDDANSPHGRANKRIMKGLVAWMEAHRADIAGLDTARPLLPQLDKLSDDQLRAAMRSMDPWAPK